jgi:hypothetical protein
MQRKPNPKEINAIICGLRSAAEQYSECRNAVAEEVKRLKEAGAEVAAQNFRRVEEQLYRQWEEARLLADDIEDGQIVLN